MILFEFPFLRLIDYFITPYITHDKLLAQHNEKSKRDKKEESLLVSRDKVETS